MERIASRFWRAPNRLTPNFARIVAGLSLVMFAIAALGFGLYDGWHRIAYVAAFILIGLANLALAAGSLLPDERGGSLARLLVIPLALLMFVALAVTLVLQRSDLKIIFVLGGLLGLAVTLVLRRDGVS